MHNYSENLNPMLLIGPDSFTTEQTSDIYDMKRAEKAVMVVQVKSIDTGECDVTVYEATTSGGSYTALTDGDIQVDEAGISLVDLKSFKRYIKVVATPDEGTTIKLAVAILGDKGRYSTDEPEDVS